MFGSSFFYHNTQKGFFLVSLYANVKLTEGTFEFLYSLNNWSSSGSPDHRNNFIIYESVPSSNMLKKRIIIPNTLIFEFSLVQKSQRTRYRAALRTANTLLVKRFLLFAHRDDISTEDCVSVTLNLMFVLFVHVYSTCTNWVAIGMI